MEEKKEVKKPIYSVRDGFLNIAFYKNTSKNGTTFLSKLISKNQKMPDGTYNNQRIGIVDSREMLSLSNLLLQAYNKEKELMEELRKNNKDPENHNGTNETTDKAVAVDFDDDIPF